MRKPHLFGKRRLLAILICLSWSCAGPDSNSGYRVTLPILEVAPKQGPCQIQDPDALTFLDGDCTAILTSDYKKILIELISACLALGGSEGECRAR